MAGSVWAVCGTAFLYMLGLSVLFPVLPRFVQELGIGDGQAGVLLSSYALGTVLTGSLWGRFSQRVGRKPVLLIGLGGFALTFAGFGLGHSFAELLAARLLGGLLAGALMPAIPAYLADVTDAGSTRQAAMGLFGAALGSGVLCGVVVGGFLGELGPRVPFFASAAIGALALLGVALGLPESLPRSARGLGRGQGGAMGRAAAALGGFLGFSFLIQVSRSALEAGIGFLARDRFGAGTSDVGLVLGGVTLLAVAIQGGAMRSLYKHFAVRSLLLAGALLLAGGLFGIGLAPSWSWLWATGGLCGVGAALVEPTFRAELSRVGEDFQGEAQGLNSSVQSLGRVVAFSLFPGLLSATSPELAFGVSALLAVLAAAVARLCLWAPLRQGAGLPGAAAAPASPRGAGVR